MSQKINPTANKLGILKVWTLQVQKYGRNFKGYVKFIQSFNSTQIYIKRKLNQSNLLVDNIEITQFSNWTLVKIFIFNLKQHIKQGELSSLVNIILKWLKCYVKIVFYYKTSINNSSTLVSNYIKYLFNQKNCSPKKIFQLIFKVVKNHSYKKKVIYTTKGLQLTRLVGFKLELRGCFESSRTQMTRTLKCNFGSVPLTKLNGYIDYSTSTFFTKFGSCGFKLWFFYVLV